MLGVDIGEGYVVGLSLHLASGIAVIPLLYHRVLHVARHTLELDIDEYTKGYLLALALSIATGLPLYTYYKEVSEAYGSYALLIIAIGLLVTTAFLARASGRGVKKSINLIDWIITGFLQGLAVLPGFSRSGLTIGYLCIRGYEPGEAVEASLLLAIPVLIASGAYNLVHATVDPWIAMATQIIVLCISIVSARILIGLAHRVRAYLFTLILALATIAGLLLVVVD